MKSIPLLKQVIKRENKNNNNALLFLLHHMLFNFRK